MFKSKKADRGEQQPTSQPYQGRSVVVHPSHSKLWAMFGMACRMKGFAVSMNGLRGTLVG